MSADYQPLILLRFYWPGANFCPWLWTNQKCCGLKEKQDKYLYKNKIRLGEFRIQGCLRTVLSALFPSLTSLKCNSVGYSTGYSFSCTLSLVVSESLFCKRETGILICAGLCWKKCVIAPVQTLSLNVGSGLCHPGELFDLAEAQSWPLPTPIAISITVNSIGTTFFIVFLSLVWYHNLDELHYQFLFFVFQFIFSDGVIGFVYESL